MRDDRRAYMVEYLVVPDALLIVGETSFLKQGEGGGTAVVQRSRGAAANYQVGDFLAYTRRRGSLLGRLVWNR